MTIAMTLTGMIFIAGPHTGAAVNPAVGFANHFMSTKLFKQGAFHDYFIRTYIVGGVIGGISAGFCSYFHNYFIEVSRTMNVADLALEPENAQATKQEDLTSDAKALIKDEEADKEADNEIIPTQTKENDGNTM